MRPDATTTVAVPDDHDLVGSLRLLRLGRLDPTWALRGDEVWHASWTPQGPVTTALRSRLGCVEARTWGPGSAWILPRLPRAVGAHDAPGRFAPRHPRVRAWARAHPGLHLPVVPVFEEGLVPVILQQRVTYAEAARSWRLLCRTWGRTAPGPLALTTPPQPEVVADQPYAAFHPLGIEQKRALVLREVYRRRVRWQSLVEGPPADAVAMVTRLPGIGPWTASLWAGSALADADAVPLGDVHLPHTVAWALTGRPRADDREMLALLAPFRPHRWRVIRLLVLAGVRPPARGPGRRSRWPRGA